MYRDDILLQNAARNEDYAVKVTEELIEIQTINPPGNCYTDAAEYLRSKIAELGLVAKLVEVGAESSKSIQEKSASPRVSVLGYLDGEDPRFGLHLNGHYDAVPPGAGWTLDPFKPVLKDGRLHGLGASDMKSGVGAALGTIRALVDTQTKLHRGISFSFTPDEETGGYQGLGHLAANGFIKSDCAIITEPSQPDIVKRGHKGDTWLELTTRGKTAHGSQSRSGINAFEKMMDLYPALKELTIQLSKRKSRYAEEFEFSEYPGPSMMIGGIVRTGSAVNVVPDKCVATVDRRLIPEESADDAMKELSAAIEKRKEQDKELKTEIRMIFRVDPTMTPADAAVCQVVTSAHERVNGKKPRLVIGQGTNDTKFLRTMCGIPAVVYGPGLTEQAHKPDEYVPVSNITNCVKVLLLSAISLTQSATH